jgi:HK97 family phage major capsid protein
MPRSAQDYVSAYQRIYAEADAAGRDLTPRERERVAELMNDALAQKNLEELERKLGGTTTTRVFADSRSNFAGGADPGAQFVASQGYKMVKSSELRGQSWTSGPIEVRFKGTMVEGAGGTLVPPDYTGGIVRTNFTPTGLADYFGTDQTMSNSVRYSLEGTATSGVTGVPELGVKPESTLALSEVAEPVKKLATTLPVSDELLDDAPGLRGYINERLTLFLRLKEEEQILRGSGGDNLTGIFNRGISTLGLGTATANHVQIFRAAAGIRGSAFVDPDLVVVHPTDWVTMRLRG